MRSPEKQAVMDAHTRQQAWEEVGQSLRSASRLGERAATMLRDGHTEAYGRFASVEAGLATWHANRALDLLDQLRGEG